MTLHSLPDCARKFLKYHRGDDARLLLAQFHEWMEENHISLNELQQLHIDNFLTIKLPDHQKVILHRYLDELYLAGLIAYDPKTRSKKIAQPLISDYFDRQKGQIHRRPIIIFHRWLASQKINLSFFRIEHIEQFISKPKLKDVCTATKLHYRREVYKYLAYLIEYKAISITADELDRAIKKPAPQLLEKFLRELEISRKLGTVKGYRTTLLAFYSYLNCEHLALCCIGRQEIVQWFQLLKDKQLHPATRLQRVIHLKVYLYWLHSQSALEMHPSKLVFRTDFPKLPTYLPRPLSPEVDQELQKFLGRRRHIAAKGLLLMRKTGLRIGELTSLEYDARVPTCMLTRFLKYHSEN